MTTVKLSVYVDIESAINDAIENVGLTGMGADGTSEYEITDVAVAEDGSGGYEVDGHGRAHRGQVRGQGRDRRDDRW